MFAKRRLIGLIFFGNIALSGTASADNLSIQMEACGAIIKDANRLSCFDTLFSRQQHIREQMRSNPPELIGGHGHWIGVKKQLIKGQVASAILLPAKGVPPDAVYIPGRNYQNESFIRIDCSHGRKSAFLHWPRDLGHRDIALDFKFDHKPAQREVWKVTLDGNTVRPKSDQSRESFINGLWSANSLKVTIPRNGLTQQYDLAGFQGMSNDMQEVCQWVESMQ